MQKLSSADSLTKFNQIPVADSSQTQFKLNAPPNCARDRLKKKPLTSHSPWLYYITP